MLNKIQQKLEKTVEKLFNQDVLVDHNDIVEEFHEQE
jgi:hypothetical protein